MEADINVNQRASLSEAEINRIIQLRKQQVSYGQIAREIGRSESFVQRFCNPVQAERYRKNAKKRRIGEVRKKRLTEADSEKMRKMRADGATVLDLMAHFDCAKSTVQRHLKMGRQNQARRTSRGGGTRQPASVGHIRLHTRAMADRLMDQIPRDTRDLTARAFGDPLPGRSALDAKQQ